MAARIAEYITQKLIIASTIEEGDRELYCYGFFLLTTRLFFFLVTAATGFVAGVLLESILFYTVFMLLRTYAGGVHAKTETKCTILTILALSVSVYVISLMKQINCPLFNVIMIIAASLSIIALCPLDSNDKQLTKHEKRHYQVICYILVAMCLICALGAMLFSLDVLLYPIAWGMFLEGLLLWIGSICNKRNPVHQ